MRECSDLITLYYNYFNIRWHGQAIVHHLYEESNKELRSKSNFTYINAAVHPINLGFSLG